MILELMQFLTYCIYALCIAAITGFYIAFAGICVYSIYRMSEALIIIANEIERQRKINDKGE